MPYSSIRDLPVTIRRNLPERAQEIFLKTFNNVYDRTVADETRAFKIAWSAVKRRFEKRDGIWVPKAS